MPLTTLNNILKSARDSSGTLFSSTRLKRRKSECIKIRTLQTQTEFNSPEEENNAVLRSGSTSLWRSLTGREEGWRLTESEQAEHVFNYYKNRSSSENIEKEPAENPLGGGVYEDSLASGKSLYSQWATRRPSRRRDLPKPSKSMNDFVVSSNHDPFRHQQASWLMNSMSRPNDSSDIRQRCLERLRRPLSVPTFWVIDKSPLDLLSNNNNGSTATGTKNCQQHLSRASTEPTDDFGHEENLTGSKKEVRKEPAVKCIKRHERDRSRPVTAGSAPTHFSPPDDRRMTAGSAPINFLPDDIPLFDVKTRKKKNVCGGRSGVIP